MAKAASPLRLQAELVEQAKHTGVLYHRSIAEQIEYWADLGRNVDQVLDPSTLLKLHAGAVRVNVEPINAPAVDPDELFASLEQSRQSGALARSVTQSRVRYQASNTHPGLLERVTADGVVTLGQFASGSFKPLDDASSR